MVHVEPVEALDGASSNDRLCASVGGSRGIPGLSNKWSQDWAEDIDMVECRDGSSGGVGK